VLGVAHLSNRTWDTAPVMRPGDDRLGGADLARPRSWRLACRHRLGLTLSLTMKVREGGRVIKIAVMVATGVNADGYREILGVATSTAESGAGWNSFLKNLVARGLSGVALVTSDAHVGLVDAISANLPGATWQRCRTHYTVNLMSVCPKHAWGGVKAMLHSVFDQIDADAVHTQHGKLLDNATGARGARPPRHRP
jgi:transposase-like protein